MHGGLLGISTPQHAPIFLAGHSDPATNDPFNHRQYSAVVRGSGSFRAALLKQQGLGRQHPSSGVGAGVGGAVGAGQSSLTQLFSFHTPPNQHVHSLSLI
jgi:hypothetical protein